jgi:hypothetical protein
LGEIGKARRLMFDVNSTDGKKSLSDMRKIFNRFTAGEGFQAV